jgi:hypothetical protein
MSAEKIINTEQNPSILNTPKVNKESFSGVVDINHLLARARKAKRAEYKINFIFFSMFVLLVLIIGIILSL